MLRYLGLATAAVVLSASLCAQVTRHVPADQPTIQAAINASANGDIVVVAPGTYFENLVIAGKNIKLTSSGGAAVTIVDGMQLGPVLSILPGRDRSLLIENLTFRNGRGNNAFVMNTGAQGGGIDIRLSTPTIVRCNILNNFGGMASNAAIGGAGGILVRGDGPHPQGPAIRNCNIKFNQGGTGVAPPTGGPVVAHGGGGGILLEESVAFIRACVITDNVGGNSIGGPNFRGAGAGGIGIILPHDTTIIEDCAIHDNVGGLALTGATVAGAGGIGSGGTGPSGMNGPPHISYCALDGNVGGDALAPNLPGVAGTTVAGAGGIDCVAATIETTYVRNNHGGTSGIDAVRGGAGGIGTVGNTTINSCSITDNVGGDDLGGPGIAGAGGLHSVGGIVTVLATTFSGNTSGIDLNPGPISESIGSGSPAGGAHIDGGSADIVGSIFWGDHGDPGFFNLAVGDEIGGFGTINVSFCNVEGNYPGVSNFDLDPLFVDPMNGDYHLGAGSPCIDAGDSSAMMLTAKDIDGDPRLVGQGIDCGADESTMMIMPGSLEDLELGSVVNNTGSAAAAAKFVRSGDVIELRVFAPGSCFAASDMFVLGSPLPTGSTIPSVANLPGFHLDPANLLLLGPGPLPFWEAPYGCGKRFFFNVNATFPGWSLFVQGFALDANAANGWFAVTNVHELRFD